MSHYSHHDSDAETDAERSLSDVIAELRRKREDIEAGRDIAPVNAPPPPVQHADGGVAPSMFAYHLRMELIERENALLDKNRKYGNSALEPMRVFSRSGPRIGVGETRTLKSALLSIMLFWSHLRCSTPHMVLAGPSGISLGER